MTTARGTTAAVVFDFDGVLADTERLHLAAFQQVFTPRRWALNESAYFERYLGFDDEDLVDAYVRDHGFALDEAARTELLRQKASHYADLVASGSALYAHATACVRALAAHFPLAIASGSLRAEIEAILAPADLRDAFRAIVGADDVARSKPAPDTYTEAVKRLGIAAADAVAVEDSQWGLASAREAGLRTIGLTTSYPASALTDADRIITSLAELTPDFVRKV